MAMEMIATPDDVRHAYRLLLGREPDPDGLRAHLEWLRTAKPGAAALAARMMSSDEYRARVNFDSDYVPVDMGGYTVYARKGDALIASPVIAGAKYEDHVKAEFDNRLFPGAYVLDIGANIGLFAMHAAVRVGPSGRVIAVEPLPQNHRALYSGIVHNGLANVDVLPFAASDAPALLPALCMADSSNGIVGAKSSGNGAFIESYVPAFPLDSFLSSLPRLDIVKIDIEGNEPKAWKGMLASLQRFRPIVFTEFSPIAMRNVGNSAPEYLALLFDYGNAITVLRHDGDQVPCRQPDAVMAEWERANKRLQMQGEVHVDLLIDVGDAP
jgi:FkbM family methyltransferase